jgi:hypothetical protein
VRGKDSTIEDARGFGRRLVMIKQWDQSQYYAAPTHITVILSTAKEIMATLALEAFMTQESSINKHLEISASEHVKFPLCVIKQIC